MDRPRALGSLSIALFAVGCGGGKGDVTFTTWGEAYIETGLPTEIFVDGWSVTYSKFVLSIDAVHVGTTGGKVGGDMAKAKVFDHTTPGIKSVFAIEGLEATTWDDVSFEIVTPAVDADVDASADAADRDSLVTNGAALHVIGTATDGTLTKSFDWTLTKQTEYAECKGEVDGQLRTGVLVTNGGDDEVQLTIHGDHFFYDDLQSPNAAVRFQPIADADADMDGEVTLAELDAVDLVDVPVGTYGTGSASGVNTLGDFVRALSQTIGHFRGEGECESLDL